MKRSLLICLLLLAVLVMISACSDDSGDENPDGDNSTDGDESTDGDDATDGDEDGDEGGDEDGDEDGLPPGDPFRIVVISDTHVRLPGNPDDEDYENQDNLEHLEAAVATINADYSDADFVAVTGDLVGCLYSEDPADYDVGLDNPADAFKERMDELTVPYHAVLGNHDYQKDYDPETHNGINTDNIEAIESVWKKVLDIEPYYSMVHEGIRLLFLNPNRGDLRTDVCMGSTIESFCTGSFEAEQLAWLETELDNGDPTLIFMHHPLVTDDEDSMFAMLDSFAVDPEDGVYDILESYKDIIMAVFVGHGHIWERDLLFDSIWVYETGSIADSNGNAGNIHVVDVDPAVPGISVTMHRDDADYWGEW